MTEDRRNIQKNDRSSGYSQSYIADAAFKAGKLLYGRSLKVQSANWETEHWSPADTQMRLVLRNCLWNTSDHFKWSDESDTDDQDAKQPMDKSVMLRRFSIALAAAEADEDIFATWRGILSQAKGSGISDDEIAYWFHHLQQLLTDSNEYIQACKRYFDNSIPITSPDPEKRNITASGNSLLSEMAAAAVAKREKERLLPTEVECMRYWVRCLLNDNYADARKLSRNDRETVREIIVLSAHHPQTLDVLVKACRARQITAQEMLARLQDAEFDLTGIDETVLSSNDITNDDFMQQMIKLYDICAIVAADGDEEQQVAALSGVLKALCVLKPVDVKAKVLREWLNLPDYSLLGILSANGWLQKRQTVIDDKTCTLITMPQVLAEIVQRKANPRLSEVRGVIEKIRNELKNNQKKTDLSCLFQARNILNFFDDNSVLLGEMAAFAGDTCSELNRIQEAIIFYERAISIRQNELGQEHPYTVELYKKISEVYKKQGDFGKARHYSKKADESSKKTIDPEYSYIAGGNIADNASDNNLFISSDYAEALAYYQKNLENSKKSLGAEHPGTLRIYDNIAGIYRAQGKYDKAMGTYHQVLDLRKKILGPEHQDTAATYIGIANIYFVQGINDQALAYYQRAREIYEKVLGAEHQDTAAVYNNIAEVYKARGNYSGALEFNLKALSIREKLFGNMHPATAISYNNIGGVYRSLADYSQALDYYQKSLAIYVNVLAYDHPNIASTYNNIAGVYFAQGNYDNALEYYEKALDIKEKVLGKEHPDTATGYSNIAAVYKVKGDFYSALKYYEKALNIRKSKLREGHPKTAAACWAIADIYQMLNEPDKAHAFVLQAMACENAGE